MHAMGASYICMQWEQATYACNGSKLHMHAMGASYIYLQWVQATYTCNGSKLHMHAMGASYICIQWEQEFSYEYFPPVTYSLGLCQPVLLGT